MGCLYGDGDRSHGWDFINCAIVWLIRDTAGAINKVNDLPMAFLPQGHVYTDRGLHVNVKPARQLTDDLTDEDAR